VTAAAPVNLDQVRAKATPHVFPTDLLRGLDSALLVFCAGFLGANDGIHVHDAGIPNVVGIDNNPDMCDTMRALYPAWDIRTDDVYSWLAHVDNERRQGRHRDRYDIVIVDCQTSQSELTHRLIRHYTALAKRTVVTGVMPDTIRQHNLGSLRSPYLPPGWALTRLTRRNAAGAHWLVAQRQRR
jgi:hypothetical protein